MVNTVRIEPLLPEEENNFVGYAMIDLKPGISKDAIIEIAQSSSSDMEAVQILDSILIVDDGHVLSAVQNAVNAHRGNYAKSRTLDVEIAVYASGQRQISRAFELVGVSDDTSRSLVIIVGTNKSQLEIRMTEIMEKLGTEVENPFFPDIERLVKIQKVFDISEIEIATYASSTAPIELQNALSKCVSSRVSMVALDS